MYNMRLSVPAESPRSNEEAHILTMPCSLTIRISSSNNGSCDLQDTSTKNSDQITGIESLRTSLPVSIVHKSVSKENTRTEKPFSDQSLNDQSHSSIKVCVQSEDIIKNDQILLVGPTNVIVCDNTDKISNFVEYTHSDELTIGKQISSDNVHSVKMEIKPPIDLRTLNGNKSAVSRSGTELTRTNAGCSSATHESREQRHRQHRGRRQERTHQMHPQIRSDFEVSPDFLDSNLHPPPYTTLPIHPVQPQINMAQENCGYNIAIPVIRRSPSERSGKGCCGHWFSTSSLSSLRALIAFVALSGVATAICGAALGASGTSNTGQPPSSLLIASLLMIAVGVILITISGAAWRMTVPSCPGHGNESARCDRIHCISHGLLYPEFQHRAPPPSYQASMQEYRLRFLLLNRDRQGGLRSTVSPPPTYRSVASLLRVPLRCMRGTLSRSIHNLPMEHTTERITNSNSRTGTNTNSSRENPNININTINSSSSTQSMGENLYRCHQTKTKSIANRTQLSKTEVPATSNNKECCSIHNNNNLASINNEMVHKKLQYDPRKAQDIQKTNNRVTILQRHASELQTIAEIDQSKNDQSRVNIDDKNLITVVTVTGYEDNQTIQNNVQTMKQNMEIIAHV